VNFLDALKSRAGTVVLIDNDFAWPKVEDPDGNDRTAFYRSLQRDAAARERVAAVLELDQIATLETVMGAVDARIGELWEQYVSKPGDFPDLAVLFLATKANFDAQRKKLEILTAFCETSLGVKPIIHHDLTDAKEALGSCMIAFVDFYLKAGVNNFEGAMEEHAQYKDIYRKGFEHDNASWPKVVFLISSKLPPPDQLQAFRDTTGIRSAFFTGIRKGDLSLETLQSLMDPWGTKYDPTAQLDRYLSALSNSVGRAASTLAQEINRLELHDLRMLNVLRLSAEGESLQSYLTWLLSEALASKLRASKPLQTALLPEPRDMPQLDGQLLTQSVLFELFADIAVSLSSGEAPGPEFGDIYAIASEKKGGGRDLLLAISPACDLARCAKEDQVLCVKGSVANADASLAPLLSKKALYGKGNHVIRFKEDNTATYAHVIWTLKKGLITQPVADLMDSKRFKKVGRLSEIFAQEVKDLALSDASRVGTPIEPTFAIASNVIVRAQFGVQGEDPLKLQCDLNDETFISAVLTKGRTNVEDSNLAEIIVFTLQFSNWLLKTFLPQLIGDRDVPPKVKAVSEKLASRTEWHVALGPNRSFSECDGALCFKVLDDANELPTLQNNRLEILVSAKGN
jgi:hypothetical protein